MILLLLKATPCSLLSGTFRTCEVVESPWERSRSFEKGVEVDEKDPGGFERCQTCAGVVGECNQTDYDMLSISTSRFLILDSLRACRLGLHPNRTWKHAALKEEKKGRSKGRGRMQRSLEGKEGWKKEGKKGKNKERRESYGKIKKRTEKRKGKVERTEDIQAQGKLKKDKEKHERKAKEGKGRSSIWRCKNIKKGRAAKKREENEGRRRAREIVRKGKARKASQVEDKPNEAIPDFEANKRQDCGKTCS